MIDIHLSNPGPTGVTLLRSETKAQYMTYSGAVNKWFTLGYTQFNLFTQLDTLRVIRISIRHATPVDGLKWLAKGFSFYRVRRFSQRDL